MCNACVPSFDASRSEAFAETMAGLFNGAATCLMISIGHRSGLFDTLARLEPSTSGVIAEAAGLNERYVREWLAAMVVSEIVEYDPSTETYHLPVEHAALLTRAAAPDNLAVTAQFFPVLGSVEDDLLECFRNGGGVPYEKYERFHEVMAEDSGQTVVAPLIDRILPLAPGLIPKLEAGARVLDVGCGQGRALVALARRFPRSRFTGIDFSEEAIEMGRAEAGDLPNLALRVKNAADLDEAEAYDVIFTFDAVHDQADPLRVLRNIHRALKADGIYLMQDIAGSSRLENNRNHPFGPLLYTISCLHCMSVSLAQGGTGLGAMWGEECAERMAREAGFREFITKKLEHDPLNNFYILRK